MLPIGGHSAATLRVAADGASRHRAMPVLLADRVPKIRYRLKERDWLDHTEKDGGQDGTVTR